MGCLSLEMTFETEIELFVLRSGRSSSRCRIVLLVDEAISRKMEPIAVVDTAVNIVVRTFMERRIFGWERFQKWMSRRIKELWCSFTWVSSDRILATCMERINGATGCVHAGRILGVFVAIALVSWVFFLVFCYSPLGLWLSLNTLHTRNIERTQNFIEWWNECLWRLHPYLYVEKSQN